MENGKKLDIVHIVQGLSERLLGPFIADISSQYTGHVNFLSWLDRSWKLQRI
jgi:hypothetical protein